MFSILLCMIDVHMMRENVCKVYETFNIVSARCIWCVHEALNGNIDMLSTIGNNCPCVCKMQQEHFKPPKPPIHPNLYYIRASNLSEPPILSVLFRSNIHSVQTYNPSEPPIHPILNIVPSEVKVIMRLRVCQRVVIFY